MLSKFDAVIATGIVFVLYVFAAACVKHRWQHKYPIFNPLKIVADNSGRTSLSLAQVFFFTLIFIWLAVYWVFQEGKLVPISHTMLGLLGIAVAGSGVGKLVDSQRFRVSGENWAWAKRKRWIQRDFTRAPLTRTPTLSDLVTSDQGFEVSRFQAASFTLIVGIAILHAGATAENASAFSSFKVDDAYLILIGLSQGVYVGGKAVGGNPIQDLNSKLSQVRSLELEFTKAVALSTDWQQADEGDRTELLARDKCAPDKYEAYMSAAGLGAEMIGELTGKVPDSAVIQPRLPTL